MVSLATSILKHDKRSFIAAVVTIAVALAIVFFQVALLQGYVEQTIYLLKRANADLWIVSSKTETFEWANNIHRKNELPPVIHPQVASVESIMSTTAFGKTDTGFVIMDLLGFSKPEGFAVSNLFGDKAVHSLRTTTNILIEERILEQWNVNIGDVKNIMNIPLRIVGTVENFSSEMHPVLISSKETAQMLSHQGADSVQYILLYLTEGAEPAEVAEELSAKLNNEISVYTTEDFESITTSFWYENSGLGSIFIGSAVVAAIIGFVIIQQIIRVLILNNLNEYATMRAMGVSGKKLAKVVMQQCFWIAVTGYVTAIALAILGYFIAASYDIVLSFPFWLFVVSAVVVLLLCLMAGVFSLRNLYKTEPADLLRV